MRIGLAVYGNLETLSGGYLYDRHLVEFLRSQNDDVEIISMPWQNYFFHLSQNFVQSHIDRFYNLNIDILIQDELNHPSFTWMNSRILQKTKYPIISLVHHLRTSEKHKKSLKWVYRQVEKNYLSSVDGFIFNSQTTRRAVEALCGEKVRGVVAYPSGASFDVDITPHRIVQRAHESELQLLFVGNIIPRKGLHTLIDALGQIKNSLWQLNIVGQLDVDPVYIQKINSMIEERSIRDKINFLGKISNEKLRDKYFDSHVLVVPSLYEGFGIVYLEAMSFGVLPIASTAGGAREIIFSGQDGFLIPIEDSANLAGKLIDLINDRNKLAAMSVAAWHKFKKYPTWEQTGRTIRDFLLTWMDFNRISEDS
jgi:glycosyltransferase involved in cell wall biosynthesis